MTAPHGVGDLPGGFWPTVEVRGWLMMLANRKSTVDNMKKEANGAFAWLFHHPWKSVSAALNSPRSLVPQVDKRLASPARHYSEFRKSIDTYKKRRDLSSSISRMPHIAIHETCRSPYPDRSWATVRALNLAFGPLSNHATKCKARRRLTTDIPTRRTWPPNGCAPLMQIARTGYLTGTPAKSLRHRLHTPVHSDTPCDNSIGGGIPLIIGAAGEARDLTWPTQRKRSTKRYCARHRYNTVDDGILRSGPLTCSAQPRLRFNHVQVEAH
ncbi:hypothetical protein NM208_g10651 [Fusarium decemcellulare]|uniref:Uncharacterized protein n=1 Tax=Fusarium decemcellulare TaxID=57161 RepID=A0ACC1RXK4_9HYPO|nr:hypothetical protein NM208_g10651 [Fusarium decemcellulare]